MKARMFVVMLTVLSGLSATASAQSIVRLRMRCEEDSLTPAEARNRVDWFLMNYFEDARVVAGQDTGQSLDDQQTREWWTNTCLVDALGHTRIRPLYPTFGNSMYENPLAYFAPPPTAAHPGAGAPLPDNYQVLGLCTSSCYKPDGLVRFEVEEEGQSVFKDVAMGEAFSQQLANVVALSDDSTLENPQLVSIPIDSYTVSATPTDHQIFVFETDDGGKLEVTGNHPVVDASGSVREAKTFEVGEALVRVDGSLAPITSIAVETYHGRVYNLAPRTPSLLGNIVVANGFLNGSSWYQNDGSEYLNTKLFRGTLPDEILE